MLPIAGQTAEPVELKFFVDTQFFKLFFFQHFVQFFLFNGQRRALQLVTNKGEKERK